ncbi:hypothetical protein BT69DRAFT_1284397 [Atractiella rhizophila]|nr:hypothetical protein BT69DRAFT_1284397 [Atractiella rhizophila]
MFSKHVAILYNSSRSNSGGHNLHLSPQYFPAFVDSLRLSACNLDSSSDGLYPLLIQHSLKSLHFDTYFTNDAAKDSMALISFFGDWLRDLTCHGNTDTLSAISNCHNLFSLTLGSGSYTVLPSIVAMTSFSLKFTISYLVYTLDTFLKSLLEKKLEKRISLLVDFSSRLT